jgi:hypothetical protein
MISPIWTAVTIALLLVGLRLLQRSGHAPRWLRAVRPDVSVGWTVAAAIIGIVVIAALDSTGAFRAAIGAPETPTLLIGTVLLLQIAVLLSVVVILRRGRASH